VKLLQQLKKNICPNCGPKMNKLIHSGRVVVNGRTMLYDVEVKKGDLIEVNLKQKRRWKV